MPVVRLPVTGSVGERDGVSVAVCDGDGEGDIDGDSDGDFDGEWLGVGEWLGEWLGFGG